MDQSENRFYRERPGIIDGKPGQAIEPTRVMWDAAWTAFCNGGHYEPPINEGEAVDALDAALRAALAAASVAAMRVREADNCGGCDERDEEIFRLQAALNAVRECRSPHAQVMDDEAEHEYQSTQRRFRTAAAVVSSSPATPEGPVMAPWWVEAAANLAAPSPASPAETREGRARAAGHWLAVVTGSHKMGCGCGLWFERSDYAEHIWAAASPAVSLPGEALADCENCGHFQDWATDRTCTHCGYPDRERMRWRREFDALPPDAPALPVGRADEEEQT